MSSLGMRIVATGLCVLALVLPAPAANLYWDTSTAANLQAGPGTWDTAPASTFWSNATTGSSPLLPWTDGSDAYFNPNGTSAITIGTVTANSVNISGTGYTLSGGTLTNTTGTFALTQAATINSVIAGTTVTKTGGGTLTLGGANTYTGLTTINNGAGTVILNSASGNAIPGNLTIGSAGSGAAWVQLARSNQIADTSLVTFNGSSGNHPYIKLMGYSETVAGIVCANGAGVIEVVESDAGVTADSTFTILTANAADNFVYNGYLRDKAGGTSTGKLHLVKSGPGIQTIYGTISYSGDTTVNGGTLKIGNNNQIPDGAGKGNLIVSSPGVFDLNAFDETINGLSGTGTVTNAGTAAKTLTVGNNNATSTFSGTLTNGAQALHLTKTGTGVLTISGVNTTGNLTVGGGTLVLTGTNTYTGTTTVNSGTLQYGQANAIPNGGGKGNVVVNSPGILDVNGLNSTINGLSGSGTIDNLAAGAATLTIGNNNQGGTFTGSIQNTGGALNLVKTGTGTLYLNGPGTYSGTTTLNSGYTQFGSPASIGGVGRSLTVNSGAVLMFGGAYGPIQNTLATRVANTSAGVIALNSFEIAEDLDFSAAGANLTAAQLGAVVQAAYTGTLTPNGGTYRLGGGSGKLILPNTNALTGANNVAYYGAGGGTVLVTGTNDYTGSTTLTANTLSVFSLADGGVASGLGASSNAASNLVFGGGTLQYLDGPTSTDRLFTLSNVNASIYASGYGPVQFTNTGALATINSGSRTLNLRGTNTGDNTLAAAIANGSGGTTAVNKDDAGKWILTGASSYTGNTTVNGGVIQFASSGAIGGTARNVTVNSGGAVAFGPGFGPIQSTLTGRIVNGSAGTVALTANSSENLDFSAAGANLTAAYLGATETVVYTGTLTPNGTTYRLGGGGGTLTLSNTNALTGATNLIIGGGGGGYRTTGGGTTAGAPAGTVILTGDNDYTQGTTLQGALGDNSGNLVGTALSAASYAKLGSGNLTFNNGIFQFLPSSGGFDLSTRTVTFTGSGAIDTNGNNVTFANSIGAGAGHLIKTGAGTLTLAGGTGYTGNTTVTGGTLRLGAPASYNGATLLWNGMIQLGADEVIPSGTGKGNVTLYGGTLDLNGHTQTVNNLATWSGTVLSSSGPATLVVNSTGNTVIPGLLTDGGGTLNLVKSGTAILELTNPANTYTGKTTVNAGQLRVKFDGGLGANPASPVADSITLSGGTLMNDGQYLVLQPNRGITVASLGGAIQAGWNQQFTVNPRITGTGLLTINNDGGTVFLTNDNNDWSGGTTVAGILSVGDGGTSGTLPGNVTNNNQLIFHRSDNSTYSGQINGSGQVIKRGAGSLTFDTATAHTYGNTTVAGGTLVLDFANMATPTDILKNTANMYLQGGKLVVKGNSTGVTSQTFNSTTFNQGDSELAVDSGAGAGTTVNLKGLGRGGAAVVNFVLPTAGAINTTQGLTDGILGGWARVGSDWATKDASNNIQALSSYTALPATGGAATANYLLNANQTVTAGYTGNSLKIDPASAGQSLVLNSGQTVNFDTGGVLYTGSQDFTISGPGQFMSGGTELMLTALGSGTLRIDAPIGGGNFTKSGPGKVVVSGANVYTGQTWANQGVLGVTGSGVLGNNNNDFRIALATGQTAEVQIDSPDASIRANGVIRVGEYGDGILTQSDGTVSSRQWVVLAQNLGSTGTYNMSGGVLNVNTDAGVRHLTVGYSGRGEFNLSGGTVNILNGGSLWLGGGGFGVQSGTFNQSGDSTVNVSGTVVLGNVGSGTYNLNGGTLATPAIARGLLGTSANLAFGGGTLKATASFGSDLDMTVNAGGATFDTNGYDVTLLGKLTAGTGNGGLTKRGAGTLSVLGANTYTGPTVINDGTVIAADSSLGSGAVTVGPTGTLAIHGIRQGLLGQYAPSSLGQPAFISLDNFNSVMAGRTVMVSSSADRSNPQFDFLGSGAGFPVPYNTGSPVIDGRWTGRFMAPTAGTYSFYTASDDMSMLWIDGNLVVNNNNPQGVTQRGGSVELTAGPHDIVIGYANTGGGYGLYVDIGLPGQGIARLPNSLLQHGSNQLTIGSLAGSGTVQLGTGTLTTGGDNSDTLFAGSILGSGLLVKTGTGKFTLNGSTAGPVSVAAGTLAGIGTIGGDLTVDQYARLAPGDSIGTLTSGMLTLQPDSFFDVDLTPTLCDMVQVAGTVTLADAILNLAAVGDFASYGGTQYMIVNNDGSADPVIGIFAGMGEGWVLNSAQGQFVLTYVGGDGNDVVLTAVPEPATMALLSLAVCGLGGYIRRRRTA